MSISQSDNQVCNYSLATSVNDGFAFARLRQQDSFNLIYAITDLVIGNDNIAKAIIKCKCSFTFLMARILRIQSASDIILF